MEPYTRDPSTRVDLQSVKEAVAHLETKTELVRHFCELRVNTVQGVTDCFTIKTKTSLAFGMVPLLICGLGLTALSRLSAIDARASDIRYHWFPSTGLQGQILSSIQQIRLKEGRCSIALDEGSRQQIRGEIAREGRGLSVASAAKMPGIATFEIAQNAQSTAEATELVAHNITGVSVSETIPVQLLSRSLTRRQSYRGRPTISPPKSPTSCRGSGRHSEAVAMART